MSGAPNEPTEHSDPGDPPAPTTGSVGRTDAAGSAPHRSLPPVQRWVFWPAAGVVALFVAFALIAPKVAEAMFGAIQSSIVNTFNWYYVLIAAFFVAF